jgi:hypothetical protein
VYTQAFLYRNYDSDGGVVNGILSTNVKFNTFFHGLLTKGDKLGDRCLKANDTLKKEIVFRYFVYFDEMYYLIMILRETIRNYVLSRTTEKNECCSDIILRMRIAVQN